MFMRARLEGVSRGYLFFRSRGLKNCVVTRTELFSLDSCYGGMKPHADGVVAAVVYGY